MGHVKVTCHLNCTLLQSHIKMWITLHRHPTGPLRLLHRPCETPKIFTHPTSTPRPSTRRRIPRAPVTRSRRVESNARWNTGLQGNWEEFQGVSLGVGEGRLKLLNWLK
ncbi:hypothetical protein KC19_8G087100 [Ceratodon purpureus]|uniref:Uncharacterized protein n=1 Tax=Ceratodon purpureus TaxID=3225 RepID=A0A8T0H014_CERPU|nr:hypothetical protein KC19_8G087100 [Ceratodon purpureus]